MNLTRTPKEIKLIKKACAISDSCILIIEKSLKEKITEKELRRRIEKNIRRQRAALSFATIVACGKRSANVHAKPRATNKMIKGIGYADFGACYKGFKSDITVPFIKGKISKRGRKIVETTLNAYKLAIPYIKIGMPCWKLYEKVENSVKKHGFVMFHPIGHGLSKKIHEMPYIGKPKKKLRGKKKRLWERLKKITFQENMVFTLEPAVYVKGIGGCRIENDILLTKKGIRILTNSKLIEIK